MNEEDLFAAAKLEIFGEEPSLPATRIGRNMAMNYLGSIIRQAEAVHVGLKMPDQVLRTSLRHAFDFAEDPVMSYFPPETKRALDEYTGKFRERYEPLLEELDFRAA